MSPLYEYKCCGQTWEAFHTTPYRNCEICDECGRMAKRILSKIAKPVVMEYYSENLDAQITGPKQKSKIMKEKNVSEVGNG
jgi:hypothetical protein